MPVGPALRRTVSASWLLEGVCHWLWVRSMPLAPIEQPHQKRHQSHEHEDLRQADTKHGHTLGARSPTSARATRIAHAGDIPSNAADDDRASEWTSHPSSASGG
jgi:hypothetical protein